MSIITFILVLRWAVIYPPVVCRYLFLCSPSSMLIAAVGMDFSPYFFPPLPNKVDAPRTAPCTTCIPAASGILLFATTDPRCAIYYGYYTPNRKSDCQLMPLQVIYPPALIFSVSPFPLTTHVILVQTIEVTFPLCASATWP